MRDCVSMIVHSPAPLWCTPPTQTLYRSAAPRLRLSVAGEGGHGTVHPSQILIAERHCTAGWGRVSTQFPLEISVNINVLMIGDAQLSTEELKRTMRLPHMSEAHHRLTHFFIDCCTVQLLFERMFIMNSASSNSKHWAVLALKPAKFPHLCTRLVKGLSI